MRLGLILGGFAVIVLASVLSWIETRSAAQTVVQAADRLMVQAEAMKEGRRMLTSSWVDATGVTRTVTSNQKDSESWTAFLTRHDTEVNEAKVKWPLP